ncbi:MAG: hypothetical protein WAV72_09370 [Bradyrhizobium sp.]
MINTAMAKDGTRGCSVTMKKMMMGFDDEIRNVIGRLDEDPPDQSGGLLSL